MAMYTYDDMVRDILQDADQDLRDHWREVKPWGNRGAMVVWMDDGRIYKVQKVGNKFIKQPLTREEVERKYGGCQ